MEPSIFLTLVIVDAGDGDRVPIKGGAQKCLQGLSNALHHDLVLPVKGVFVVIQANATEWEVRIVSLGVSAKSKQCVRK